MKTIMTGTRISEDIYAELVEYAKEHRWTVSNAIRIILEDFFSKENRAS